VVVCWGLQVQGPVADVIHRHRRPIQRPPEHPLALGPH
jgi:hypothetical protein